MSIDRVAVAGVPVDLVSTAQVLHMVRATIAQRTNLQIVTVNAEFVVRALHDGHFRRVIEGAGLATPDSAGVLWALRRQGRHVTYRVGGSDLVWSLSLQAAEFGHRVFLLGGAPGVGQAAARRLTAAFPSLTVAGVYSGSPSAADEAAIVHLIRRSQADILFVAFGAPAQDAWIARNQQRANVFVAIGIGGSLDYVAGRTRRAPIWMRQHHLDWLWRLARQPWRWRRMLAIPRFVWLVFTDERGRSRKGTPGEYPK